MSLNRPSTEGNTWSIILKCLTFIPLIGFAFQTHEFVVVVFGVIRPIRDLSTNTIDSNYLAKGKMVSMRYCIFLSMSTLFILYTTFGLLGLLTFGSEVYPDIMYNFKAESPFVLFGKYYHYYHDYLIEVIHIIRNMQILHCRN